MPIILVGDQVHYVDKDGQCGPARIGYIVRDEERSELSLPWPQVVHLWVGNRLIRDVHYSLGRRGTWHFAEDHPGK